MMKIFSVQASAAALMLMAACATPSSPASSTETVSDLEGETYVASHWDNFQLRAAYLADRQGQTPALLSVNAVGCSPFADHILCNFRPEVRFADGQTASPLIEVHFRREPDGQLVQLIPVVRAP